MFVKDYHSAEFKRLVVFGESTVAGGRWLRKPNQRFADVLFRLINACQSRPVEYFNEGIGASVISPRSPGYKASVKPSAIERYQESVIEREPDLFVFCHGLNDMRCGTSLDVFMEEMETIIRDVRSVCDPVIVLATVYHMTAFDRYAPFNFGSVEITRQYNSAIADLAVKYDCLLADVWAAEGMADHVIHQDGVHANAVGNLLIAHKVFEVIAQNCSGISAHIHDLDSTSDWTQIAASMA
jgi:lysophospholipase L1-like esterase